jgi:hypothetical protein
MSIQEKLKENRPNLSQSSIKTYTSVLNSLYKYISKGSDDINLKLFNNDKIVMPLIDKMKYPATLLSALFVLTDNDVYHVAMNEQMTLNKEQSESQIKTEKQKDNMITKTEVESVINSMRNKANLIFKNNDKSQKAINILVNYILIILASGIYMEPRRSLDWSLMKYKKLNDDNEDEVNYYNSKKSEFIFNKYKTSNLYKQQVEKVPKQLKSILNKYIKYIDSNNVHGYLLFNIKNKPLNSPEIAMRLNTMFKKNISTSMLRHIYLSEKFKNMPSIKELKDTASSMGHSVSQMLEYIRKD